MIYTFNLYTIKNLKETGTQIIEEAGCTLAPQFFFVIQFTNGLMTIGAVGRCK